MFRGNRTEVELLAYPGAPFNPDWMVSGKKKRDPKSWGRAITSRCGVATRWQSVNLCTPRWIKTKNIDPGLTAVPLIAEREKYPPSFEHSSMQ